MMKRLRDQKGVALAAVVLAIVIVSVLSGVVVVASSSEVKQASIEQKHTRAYYIARSAADAVLMDVEKKVQSLQALGSAIASQEDKNAYDEALSNFYGTYVPQTGSYTHTVTIPDATNPANSYAVPVKVTRSTTTNGLVTAGVVTLEASVTIENITATSRVQLQTQEQEVFSNQTKTIPLYTIFTAPIIANGTVSIVNDKSIGDTSNRSVIAKTVSIQNIANPTEIYNRFGITVQITDSFPSYTLNLPQSGVITLSSDNINTNNGQYYSFSGNFNWNLMISGAYGKDVYLINTDNSFSFNGNGYFATNSGADVFLIAPNATSISLSGNFFKSVPSGYNAASFYIYAPNATVDIGGSFNGFFGGIYAKNVIIDDFKEGSSSKQYVVSYDPLDSSSDSSWDLSILQTVDIYYNSLTAGVKTWTK